MQIGNGAQNVSRASVGIANRGQIQAKNGGADISTDSLVNQGNIASQGQLNISATRLQNEKVSARSASITATQLDNTGRIEGGAMQVNATLLNNRGSVKTQNGALTASDPRRQYRRHQSAQALQLNATSLFNADNGVIEAQNGAAIRGRPLPTADISFPAPPPSACRIPASATTAGLKRLAISAIAASLSTTPARCAPRPARSPTTVGTSTNP